MTSDDLLQALGYSWIHILFLLQRINTAQKMKFSIKDFSSKCDQIRSFLQIWSHLLEKSLLENFIFVQKNIEPVANFSQELGLNILNFESVKIKVTPCQIFLFCDFSRQIFAYCIFKLYVTLFSSFMLLQEIWKHT